MDRKGQSLAGGPEAAGRREAVLAHLVAAGFPRVEPPILQPASIFLDLAGEDIRGRIYLTSDASGAEHCLRPEYTIPVCRAYLASVEAGRAASFSYLGPVFRFRSGGPAEFHQAGLESFGRSDREAADAEVMTIALEAAGEATGRDHDVRIGDAGLFARLLDVLDLPPVWLRRIRRGHALGKSLAAIVERENGSSAAEHAGVLAALAGADRGGARALVEDLLSIAGISSVGGRSATEIAERYLEQADAQGAGFSAEKRGVLENFLAIAGDPDAASAQLRKLARETKLDLAEALDAFDARLNFIAARGFDLARLEFAAGFARNLDYYTGFVFEAFDAESDDKRPVVGGGRYDRLMRTLGSAQDIPAVGAAIWCDRLVSAGEA